MRRLVLTLAVLLGLAFVFGVPLLLQRDDDPLPSSSDAVVVLSGPEGAVPVAKQLVDEGIAPQLVVVLDQSGRDADRDAICKKPAKNVSCIHAGPAAALGGARIVSELADTRHWDSIVIVAPRYSLLRVSRVYERCVDARIIERGVDQPWWRDAISVPLEWIKLGVAETVRRRC